MLAAKSHETANIASEASSEKAKHKSELPQPTEINPIWHGLATGVTTSNRAPQLQAKLIVGVPNDEYEREADRVADQVMRMPEPREDEELGIQRKVEPPSVQRMCAGCEEELQRQPENGEDEGLLQRQSMEEEDETVQMKDSSAATPDVSSNVVRRIDNLRGRGEPLSDSTRSYFEPLLGQDFSQVRIHTDSGSSGVARSLNARAFTVGQDIAFGQQQYAPDSNEGRRLLAHELTHVIQQQQTSSDQNIQRLPTCRNQTAAETKQREVNKILEGDRNRYKGASTELFQITDETNWTIAAQKKINENKVTSTHELAVELDKLNKGISFRKDNCIVMLMGWESPTWRSKQKRVNCSERITVFKADKSYRQYKTWEEEQVTNNLNSYELLVKHVKLRTANLYDGRTNEYMKLVKKLNDPYIGQLNTGECVAMPVGWKDPNIGQLPATPAVSTKLDEAIATVYSEQTNVKLTKQQKYIWYSIRLRITSADRGPDLTSVLSSEYHGIGTADYKRCLKDLEGGSPTIPAVKSAKKVVEDNWSNAVPTTAGKFYFHWTRKKSPSLDGYYNSSKKTGPAREKEAAFKWAKENSFQGSATATSGWHYMIRGTNTGNDARYGTMYIYV